MTSIILSFPISSPMWLHHWRKICSLLQHPLIVNSSSLGMGPCANLLYPWWNGEGTSLVQMFIATVCWQQRWLAVCGPVSQHFSPSFYSDILPASSSEVFLNLGQGQVLLWLLMVLPNFPLGLSTQQLLFSAFWPDFSLWIIYTLCKKDFFFLSWEQCYGYKQNNFLFPGKHLYSTLNTRPY